MTKTELINRINNNRNTVIRNLKSKINNRINNFYDILYKAEEYNRFYEEYDLSNTIEYAYEEIDKLLKKIASDSIEQTNEIY